MILDGKSIKEDIINNLREEVSKLNIKPHFVVIQVGNNEASNIYIKQKINMANNIGYLCDHLKYDENIKEEELLEEIQRLNNDSNIHGIMIQMPIPVSLNTNKLINTILPEKDIDGLTDINNGMLLHKKDALYSCTPKGIMELLNRYNIEISGKHAVVVGKSDLVGKPMSIMLLNAGATVTVCHSKTVDLKKYTKEADILIVATGVPHLIKSDMVKEGGTVIDVGITRTTSGLVGDVDYENVSKKVSYITPVPGGVGPMTVAMLAKNILLAYNIQINK